MSDTDKPAPRRDPLDLGTAGGLKPGDSAWVPADAVKGDAVAPGAPARLAPDETFTVRVTRGAEGFAVTGRQGPPPPADPAPPAPEAAAPAPGRPDTGTDTPKAEG